MKQIKQFLILFLSFVSLSGYANDYNLPFKTDGCTMFIDELKILDKSWLSCCVDHDFRYWVGGEKSKQDYADLKLKECLSAKSTTLIANLMYISVRIGHFSPVKHSTKWGWGNVDKKDKNFIEEQLNKVETQLYSKEELVSEF